MTGTCKVAKVVTSSPKFVSASYSTTPRTAAFDMRQRSRVGRVPAKRYLGDEPVVVEARTDLEEVTSGASNDRPFGTKRGRVVCAAVLAARVDPHEPVQLSPVLIHHIIPIQRLVR